MQFANTVVNLIIGKRLLESATESLTLARSSLGDITPGVTAEVSRVFKPYKAQIPQQSTLFDPKKPVISRGWGGNFNSRKWEKGRAASTKTTSYVKRLVVLREFDEGENTTKSRDSILVDEQFTFSNTDNEQSIKRKIIDVMTSVNESFGERDCEDLR